MAKAHGKLLGILKRWTPKMGIIVYKGHKLPDVPDVVTIHTCSDIEPYYVHTGDPRTSLVLNEDSAIISERIEQKDVEDDLYRIQAIIPMSTVNLVRFEGYHPFDLSVYQDILKQKSAAEAARKTMSEILDARKAGQGEEPEEPQKKEPTH